MYLLSASLYFSKRGAYFLCFYVFLITIAVSYDEIKYII